MYNSNLVGRCLKIKLKFKTQRFLYVPPTSCGPGQLSRYSDSLRAGRSRDRIPVRGRRGARFSAPVQNSPGDHPASYTKGTGSFPGVKRPKCGAGHTPPSSAEVKETVELHLYSTSSWHVIG